LNPHQAPENLRITPARDGQVPVARAVFITGEKQRSFTPTEGDVRFQALETIIK
jgi:hypothetical protein